MNDVLKLHFLLPKDAVPAASLLSDSLLATNADQLMNQPPGYWLATGVGRTGPGPADGSVVVVVTAEPVKTAAVRAAQLTRQFVYAPWLPYLVKITNQ